MTLFANQQSAPLASLGQPQPNMLNNNNNAPAQSPWLPGTPGTGPGPFTPWSPFKTPAPPPPPPVADPTPAPAPAPAPTPAPQQQMPSLADLAKQLGIGQNGMGIYQPEKNGYTFNALNGRWLNPTEWDAHQMNQRDWNWGSGGGTM